MSQINLLPWRQIAREERKKEFLTLLLIAAIGAALLMLPLYLFIAYNLAVQSERNTYLTAQITLLDSKIKEIKELKHQKEQLLARMTIIQELDSDRNDIVHMFDDVVRIMPEGVYLTSITRVDSTFTCLGMAESNSSISRLMRNVEQARYLSAPELKSIDTQKKDTTPMNQFELTLHERNATSKKSTEETF